LPNLGITVPDTFVWSAQFGGGKINQGQGGVAGVTLYSPPTVGGETYEFWQKSGNSWSTFFFDTFPTDFGASITAVPEPWATPLVFLLASAGIVAGVRLNKRKTMVT